MKIEWRMMSDGFLKTKQPLSVEQSKTSIFWVVPHISVRRQILLKTHFRPLLFNISQPIQHGPNIFIINILEPNSLFVV